MILEIALLSSLLPWQGVADEKYALLLEQAERYGWKIVRCSIRRAQTLFLSREVYKVTVGQEDFLVSTGDGNLHLLGLLRAGLVETAKTLVRETQVK